MFHVYSSHAIAIELRKSKDARAWTPEIKIRSVDAPRDTFRTLPVKPIIGTEAEAQKYALAAAKKWIDDGKPDMLPEQ